MVEFFFYYNLKNQNLLQEINNENDNNIEDAYIYVKNYQNLNTITIDTNHNDNKQKLLGKYVYFDNQSLDDILKKIYELNIGDKEKYKIHQQNCYLTKNDEQKFVYLII